jgi:hypothetical protein
MTNPETLPCGIEVPASAQPTVDLYKRTGVEPQDLPIQLDLPPRYDLPPEHRFQLIERSAMYYYEMLPEVPGLVPVVHGWTMEELEYSLEILMDPDKLASGSYLGAKGDWLMKHMNPHKHKVSAGSFTAPDKGKSAVDHVNPLGVGSFKGLTTVYYKDHVQKPVAIGSNKALTTVDYNELFVSRGTPQKVAVAKPGALDMGWDRPLVDKVVAMGSFTSSASKPYIARDRVIATPNPSKVDAGISEPSNTAMTAAPSKKVVAIGSNQPLSAGPLGEKLSKKKKKKPKRVSYNVIMNRIVDVLQFLTEDYEVFMLGGASPHMQHQLFMLGAKWTDTSAWRIKGLLGEIYLPERTARSIGYKESRNKFTDEDLPALRECLRDETHPFSGMSPSRFLEIGRMLMPEWYKTWEENRWEVRPFVLRCLHNAWVLKVIEEATANDYSQDPDAYYKYLSKRFENDRLPHPRLKKRLDYLYKRANPRASGQTSLTMFLKDVKK